MVKELAQWLESWPGWNGQKIGLQQRRRGTDVILHLAGCKQVDSRFTICNGQRVTMQQTVWLDWRRPWAAANQMDAEQMVEQLEGLKRWLMTQQGQGKIPLLYPGATSQSLQLAQGVQRTVDSQGWTVYRLALVLEWKLEFEEESKE